MSFDMTSDALRTLGAFFDISHYRAFAGDHTVQPEPVGPKKDSAKTGRLKSQIIEWTE
jgi:hypothetical protein